MIVAEAFEHASFSGGMEWHYLHFVSMRLIIRVVKLHGK